MINNIILSSSMNEHLLVIAGIFGINSLDFPTVTAILGALAIIAGVFLKIFEKPDKYKKEVKEEINRIIHKINEDRDRDAETRDKAIEKIENRLDKLFDYITKLIEKI